MKEILLRTGIELFREFGYDHVSVQRISETCRVTKGSFYYHFRSKEDLLLQYYDIQVKQESSRLDGVSAQGDIKEQLWLINEFFIDSSIALGAGLLRQLIKSDMDRGCEVFSPFMPRDTELTQRYISLMQQLLERGQQEGLVRRLPWRTLTITYASAFYGLLTCWAASDGSFDVKAQLKESLAGILYV